MYWNGGKPTPKLMEGKGAAVVQETRQYLQQLPQQVDTYGALLQQAWKRHSLAGSSSVLLLREPRERVAVFDVRIPPAKRHVAAGQLVPTARGGLLRPTRVPKIFMSRPRRIAIEIHGPPDDMLLEPRRGGDIMKNDAKAKQQGVKKEARSDVVLYDHEVVIVRVYKEVEMESSVNQEAEEDGEENVKDFFRSMQAFAIEDIKVLDRKEATCEIQIGHGDDRKIYDVIFQWRQDALHFTEQFNRLKELELERSKRQAELFKLEHEKQSSGVVGAAVPVSFASDHSEEKEDAPPVLVSLLVEIVSATNLPDINGNFGASSSGKANPFVVVKMGGSELHRTKVLSKTLDPVWSLQTGSLFVVQKTPEDFFSSTAGITFTVVDSLSVVGGKKVIGKVRLDHQQIFKMQGRRARFEIAFEKRDNEFESTLSSTSALYLRIKHATESEIEFMNTHRTFAGLTGVYAEETYLMPGPPEIDFLKRRKKWVPAEPGSKDIITVVRVKPYPDPERTEETTWLPSREIELESRKHSTNWVKAGSGKLGNLFVEILGCDGLPNLSLIRTSNILDKSSPFVCLVYEDTVVNTDTIADCLSPRWMPWSKRAFTFPVLHPQSDLYLSVFDYDLEQSPYQLVLTSTRAKQQHNRIGRCSVCLTQLNPDTTYELTYPLYLNGSQDDGAAPRGTISLRLRLEFNNTRRTMLTALVPPVPHYVSCPRRIDWQVARYTVEGVHDANKYSINSFARYVAELQSYREVVPYIEETLMTCLLWRGHYHIHIFGQTFWLPLHSLVAFGWALLIYRKLEYIPSFFVFCIAWTFLATNEIVRRTPSPWEKPRGYGQLLSILLFGSFFLREIEPNQGLEELREFRDSQERKHRRRARGIQLRADYDEKLKRELGFNIDEVEVEDIATKTAQDLVDTLNLQPLKPILYPVQLKLRKVVLICRFISRFFLWKEAYYAFWITTFTLLTSAIVALLPWGFILSWSIRIAVVFFTGPWWKLADWLLFYQSTEKMTEEEHDAQMREKLQKRVDHVVQTLSDYQIRRERAIKLKSMTQYLYGKFIIRIPRVSLDLFSDSPLPQSSCKVLRREHREAIVVTEEKFGQRLRGDMIPLRQIERSHPGQISTLKRIRLDPLVYAKTLPQKGASEIKKLPRKAVSGLKKIVNAVPKLMSAKHDDGDEDHDDDEKGKPDTETTPLLSTR